MTLLVFISFLNLAGCYSFDDPFLDFSSGDSLYPTIVIPEQSDWVDHGEIFTRGEEGEWDYLLWGGFGGTVVKKDSLFYLYYQGSPEYDEVFDTPIFRAIGVATSSDGLHFTKYPQNPVVSWFPNDGLEEGAVSSGATMVTDEQVVMYYGANTKVDEFLVNGDGRLAISSNGFDFDDAGLVLDHTNGELWGAGDEIFPVISFYDLGIWHVYYIPNGTAKSGKLGVAWGAEPNHLLHSGGALAQNDEIAAWGMGGYAKIAPGTYALFLNNVRNPGLEVRTVHLDAPGQISNPIHRYSFENFSQATVYLDLEASTWFMFYRTSTADAYRVKTAPVIKG